MVVTSWIMDFVPVLTVGLGRDFTSRMIDKVDKQIFKGRQEVPDDRVVKMTASQGHEMCYS